MSEPVDKGTAPTKFVSRSAARPASKEDAGASRFLGDVLVVEGSRLISKRLKRSMEADGEYAVELAHSYDEARKAVQSAAKPFFAAVVDWDMPDAPGGAVIDFTIESGLSTIVLTETLTSQIRDQVMAKDVVDYFLREERSIDAVTKKLRRLRDNKATKILVVDDSNAFRKVTANLLRLHHFELLEAEDGAAALERLAANPDTALVITDYEMPRMNGSELVHRIREKRGKDEMGVIGVSSFGSGSMSAMFLKAGADDFLTKPFEKEEFYCRVYRSIEAVEQIQAVKRAAYTDSLTGLYNRLFFFKKAPSIFDLAARDETNLAIAMIDIDKFKSINDTYGHAGGDVALRHLAGMLDEILCREHLVARFGGEEFCVMAQGLDYRGALELFERLRVQVGSSSVDHEGQKISFTLSIGVILQLGSSLDATINRADELLYQAKTSGRNRVIIEPCPGDSAAPRDR